MIDYLILAALVSIAVIGIASAADAQRRHNELIRLLNDLATMLGEMFDRDRKE